MVTPATSNSEDAREILAGLGSIPVLSKVQISSEKAMEKEEESFGSSCYGMIFNYVLEG
jgi:hypothetical protein